MQSIRDHHMTQSHHLKPLMSARWSSPSLIHMHPGVSLFSGSSSGTPIIPKHILQPVFDAEGTLDTAEWNKAPTVGCGPFVFEEWQSGSFARFVANENYWLGRPKLDELFFQFVPDDASQIAALVAGDGDIGTFFAYSDVPTAEGCQVSRL